MVNKNKKIKISSNEQLRGILNEYGLNELSQRINYYNDKCKNFYLKIGAKIDSEILKFHMGESKLLLLEESAKFYKKTYEVYFYSDILIGPIVHKNINIFDLLKIEDLHKKESSIKAICIIEIVCYYEKDENKIGKFTDEDIEISIYIEDEFTKKLISKFS